MITLFKNITIILLCVAFQNIFSLPYNFKPVFQWIRVIDETEGAPMLQPKYFSISNYYYQCDEPHCISFLLQTTNRSGQGGQVIMNEFKCDLRDQVLIPLFVIDNVIITNAPATYKMGNCEVSVTGDPNSQAGYRIDIKFENYLK